MATEGITTHRAWLVKDAEHEVDSYVKVVLDSRWHEASLKLSDCDRRVLIGFPTESVDSCAISLEKLRILEEHLKLLRRHLVSRERTLRREAAKRDAEALEAEVGK